MPKVRRYSLRRGSRQKCKRGVDDYKLRQRIYNSKEVVYIFQMRPREFGVAIRALGRVTHDLRRLSLYSNNLSRANYVELLGILRDATNLSNMHTFYFVENGIVDIEPLSRVLQYMPIQKLKYLNLNYNHFGDRGCLALSAMLRQSPNIRLRSLSLSAVGMGDVGITLIMDAIDNSPHLKGLEHFYVNQNMIGDKGCEEIARVLSESKTIRILRINLGNNEFGRRGIKAIEEAFMQSAHLEFAAVYAKGIDSRSAWKIGDSKRRRNAYLVSLLSVICSNPNICNSFMMEWRLVPFVVDYIRVSW